MMGPTHALGGVAALATYTLVTGNTDVMPVWAYGLAALGALVPDLDNERGTILNRKQFFPLKWGTFPVWIRAKRHRGFTHSLVGAALFAAVLLAWWMVLRLGFTAAGAEWPVPLQVFVVSATIGYLSHIVLDMPNMTGVELLWPLPFRFYFPPWKALRFKADSLQSEILVHVPLTLFMGWFMIENAGALAHATANDNTLPGLLRAIGQLIGSLASMLLGGSDPSTPAAGLATPALAAGALLRHKSAKQPSGGMPPYALIVVDYQNDFVDPDGSLSVPGARALLPAILAELEAARVAGAPVIYTQDWHPAETPHFAAFGGIWPAHCVGGTWGARMAPGLPVNGFIVLKGANGEDGYSGFTMHDPRSGAEIPTPLKETLHREGVDTVRVCGVATDYCVKATALDAMRLGFNTTFVARAAAAVNLQPGDGAAAIDEMRAAGVRIEE